MGRIGKASREQRQRHQLMNRLRTMVPNARSATTQLELLQYIIDYISDLQEIVDNDNDGDSGTGETRVSTAIPLKQNPSITDLSLLFSKISTTTNTTSITTKEYSTKNDFQCRQSNPHIQIPKFESESQ
uniref:BHLH domain-containing protein n=1 Tax=Setaria digitata TaxID=48799 RepID=A0A915PJK5_9BILA